MMMGIIVRGFLRDKVVFVSQMELDVDRLGELVPDMAEKHAALCVTGQLTMIEIEFPDCPPDDRFFRIGVDPSGMLIPMVKVL